MRIARRRMPLALIGLVGGWIGLVGGAEAQVIKYVDTQDLILEIDVQVRPGQHVDSNFKTKDPTKPGRVKITDTFKFDSAAFVFPAIKQTASSANQVTGELFLGDQKTGAMMVPLPEAYACGTTLARWDAKDWTGQEAGLKIKIQARCSSTEMDEAAAMKLAWPANWTKTLQSCFEPQMFVDVGPDKAYDMKPVKDLVQRWMRGKDPKTQSPVMVAKVLASEVARFVQVNGSGMAVGRTGEFQGLLVQGAAETAKKGRGSPYDVVALLVAVFREAGLPARIVIGWDSGRSEEKQGDEGFLNTKRGRGKEEMHAWVELGLLDTDAKEVWIPVDVLKLKKEGSKLPAFDKPWPYFGNHQELDGIIPFAFQYFPPTTVRAYGSPGFWGWLVMPAPPESAEQVIRFNASSVAATAETQKKEREEAEKKKRGK